MLYIYAHTHMHATHAHTLLQQKLQHASFYKSLIMVLKITHMPIKQCQPVVKQHVSWNPYCPFTCQCSPHSAKPAWKVLPPSLIPQCEQISTLVHGAFLAMLDDLGTQGLVRWFYSTEVHISVLTQYSCDHRCSQDTCIHCLTSCMFMQGHIRFHR